MALIKCSECGKEFSDKASACPNCACPIEKNVITKKIIINHKKMGFIGSGVEIFIYIDNQMIGKTTSGKSLEIELPIGKHNIRIEMPTDQATLKSSNISKDAKDFNIEPSNNLIEITISIKLGFSAGTCNIDSIIYK